MFTIETRSHEITIDPAEIVGMADNGTLYEVVEMSAFANQEWALEMENGGYVLTLSAMCDDGYANHREDLVYLYLYTDNGYAEPDGLDITADGYRFTDQSPCCQARVTGGDECVPGCPSA